MTVLVTDKGFTPLQSDAQASVQSLDLEPDANPESVDFGGHDLIRVNFPNFADGRGFTIAAVLRRRGYEGTLRAVGHVIADQYAMARRSGFDAVEISDDLAARQPEEQWVFRSDWKAHDYQSRLRAS
ncbi:DUF934 domain-containing protein [Pseudooceanicola sp. MF1-13]|uniref:DUF934 domain-containing protein n=1 Tax=Pseudooceanicola sp. MF1-13 TaxID=3379095 RepID=UPI0038912D94